MKPLTLLSAVANAVESSLPSGPDTCPLVVLVVEAAFSCCTRALNPPITGGAYNKEHSNINRPSQKKSTKSGMDESRIRHTLIYKSAPLPSTRFVLASVVSSCVWSVKAFRSVESVEELTVSNCGTGIETTAEIRKKHVDRV